MSGLTVSAALLASPAVRRGAVADRDLPALDAAVAAAVPLCARAARPVRWCPPDHLRRLPVARAADEDRRAEAYGLRRSLGSDGRMPPAIRAMFTEAQRAVLRIVAIEIGRRGRCALSIAAILKRAGVCRRVVQYALSRAAQKGLIAVRQRRRAGARNLTNVVDIVSTAWLDWLGIGCTDVRTKEKPNDFNIEDEKEAAMTMAGNDQVDAEARCDAGAGDETAAEASTERTPAKLFGPQWAAFRLAVQTGAAVPGVERFVPNALQRQMIASGRETALSLVISRVVTRIDGLADKGRVVDMPAWVDRLAEAMEAVPLDSTVARSWRLLIRRRGWRGQRTTRMMRVVFMPKLGVAPEAATEADYDAAIERFVEAVRAAGAPVPKPPTLAHQADLEAADGVS